MAPVRILIVLITLLLFSLSSVAQTPLSLDQARSTDEDGASTALTIKAVALVDEAMREAEGLHIAENRVLAETRAGDLLWASDESRARGLFADASKLLVEYLSSIDVVDPNYQQAISAATQLRFEMVQIIAQHDAEIALSVLRSTNRFNRALEQNSYPRPNLELQLEAMVASQTVSRDPARALQIAEDSLKKGISPSQVNMLSELRSADPVAAARLADEINTKLQSEDLLKSYDTMNAALSLLQISQPIRSGNGVASPPPQQVPSLLTDQAYRDLLNKCLNSALSFNSAVVNANGRGIAQNILNVLSSMQAEVERFAPGRMQEIRNATARLNATSDPQIRLNQRYQEIINKEPLDSALEEIGNAPPEYRDSFYQQLAWKAMSTGDSQRAEQIIAERISDPATRQQMTENLNIQAAQRAASDGRFSEARNRISQIRSLPQRISALIQLSQQASSRGDSQTAFNLLDEARAAIPQRAEDQQQLDSLLQIAYAFGNLKSPRGFEILGPVIDQLNEICAAAQVLNGFGQYYYRDGEMLLQSGNLLTSQLNQLSYSLVQLASVDLERSRTVAARLMRPEARMSLYLAIAENLLRDRQRRGNLVMPIHGRRITTYTRG